MKYATDTLKSPDATTKNPNTTGSPTTPVSQHPRFTLGHLVATPGALDELAECHGSRWRDATNSLLQRHLRGDWGTLCEEDLEANEWAVKNGARILSAYMLPARTPTARPVKLWIITEADRSATTILLPSEY